MNEHEPSPCPQQPPANFHRELCLMLVRDMPASGLEEALDFLRSCAEFWREREGLIRDA